jgi:hypothetical protein
MADLVVIVGVIAFGAISVGFVWVCDRIMGPDDDATVVEPAPEADGVVEVVA